SPVTGQASWARNAAMGATRSADVSRDGSSAPASSPGWAAIRVMAPGAMRFAVMPWRRPAVARLRVRPITAALAVAYDVLLGSPNNPVEVVMTTRPYPCRAMWGHAARVVLNDPATWTARWRARLSASASGNPAHRMIPALLITMSSRPKWATAPSTSAWAPA